jgi:hypothetical protein
MRSSFHDEYVTGAELVQHLLQLEGPGLNALLKVTRILLKNFGYIFFLKNKINARVRFRPVPEPRHDQFCQKVPPPRGAGNPARTRAASRAAACDGGSEVSDLGADDDRAHRGAIARGEAQRPSDSTHPRADAGEPRGRSASPAATRIAGAEFGAVGSRDENFPGYKALKYHEMEKESADWSGGRSGSSVDATRIGRSPSGGAASTMTPSSQGPSCLWSGPRTSRWQALAFYF